VSSGAVYFITTVRYLRAFVPATIIEVEKSDHDKKKITNWVTCNTILCCVPQFVKQCKENEITSKCIMEMEELSGYCITHAGNGYFGFYKLTMNFASGCTLIEKHIFMILV